MLACRITLGTVVMRTTFLFADNESWLSADGRSTVSCSSLNVASCWRASSVDAQASVGTSLGASLLAEEGAATEGWDVGLNADLGVLRGLKGSMQCLEGSGWPADRRSSGASKTSVIDVPVEDKDPTDDRVPEERATDGARGVSDVLDVKSDSRVLNAKGMPAATSSGQQSRSRKNLAYLDAAKLLTGWERGRESDEPQTRPGGSERLSRVATAL